MKLINIKKVLVGLGLIMVGLTNFAFADNSISSLGQFQTIVNNNAGTLFNIVMIVATLAGLILIIKGLVHLKQNYTGTGQEKHMSKGIASLCFGTALILAIPISHMLVGSINSSTNTFNTNAAPVNFGSVQ